MGPQSTRKEIIPLVTFSVFFLPAMPPLTGISILLALLMPYLPACWSHPEVRDNCISSETGVWSAMKEGAMMVEVN